MALYPRLVEQGVADAMSDTRVVLIVGPRQAGKTTLAKKMANEAPPMRLTSLPPGADFACFTASGIEPAAR